MKHVALAFLIFVTISHHLPAQINWEHTNGPEGAAAWHIYDDSLYAFVADEYNLFRTSDGFSWEQLPFGNLWPIATSPTKMAAGQGYGYNYGPHDPHFVVSYDHGSTWIEGTMPPTTYAGFSSIAVCSHGVYVPDGYSSKIFKTQDDGLTWDTLAPPGSYCYDLWAFEDRLYAEWYSKFWRLSVNGIDWELVSPVFDAGDYPFSMYVSDSLLFFATEENIWASKDSGATWTETKIQHHNSVDDFVKIGNRVYKSGYPSIIYTDDFGSTWQSVQLVNPLDVFDLASADGKLLGSTYNQGVFRLDETNHQLIAANENLNSAAVYYLDSGDGNLWAACGNGVFAYDLAQEKWVDKALLPLPGNSYQQVAISQSGKIACYENYYDHVYLSKDQGLSWDTLLPLDPLGGSGSISKLNWLGDVLIVQAENAGPSGMRSADLGQTWQMADVPSSIVPFNGKYYGLTWGNNLVSSGDFGLSWQDEPRPNVLYSFQLYAADDRLFFLGMDSFGLQVLYSTYDGVNWQYSSDGLHGMELFDLSYDTYTGNVWHKEDRYYFHQPSIGFFASLDSCKTWLPLERNIYQRVHAADSNFYSGGFGGGVRKTGLPQNYGSLSRGLVFNDENNNGLHEPVEAVLPQIQVHIKEPGAWYPFWFVYTKPDGQFAIGSLPGAMDTLRVNVPSNYIENINPPEHIVSASGDGRNFGVHFKPNITDVAIGGQYVGRPRPGFNLSSYLFYSNVGTIPADGKVSLKIDPNYQFISADPAPTSIFGNDSLVWDFSQLALFEHHNIVINGKLDSTVPLGSLLKMRGHIVPVSADSLLTNNHFTLCDTVVGSFDPNLKQVEPGKGLTSGEIASGKELLYTIQFQNTGTFQADRVRITDQLDSALNASTLRLVASSHPVSTFRLLPGGLLEIIFDHIALPDSNANEPESHGFVSFAIQRNIAYNAAYEIKNKAAIYFDFNEPIITNTVLTPLNTTIVSADEPPIISVLKPKLSISPNPSSQQFTLKTEGMLSGAGEIAIINMEGQVCWFQKAKELSNSILVNPIGLSAGVYSVRATAAQGILFGKLVIVR